MLISLAVVPGRPSARSPHMIGLRSPTGWPADITARLWEEHSVHISARGPCLRISPHVCNDAADVEALFSGLDAVVP